MLCCGAVARCAPYDAHLATAPQHSPTHNAHIATAPQHSPTQHDMLPQHLVCKYELNCEYRNMTLARNKAPWCWSDKIETCRSVLKCFMWNYMCIRWLINWIDNNVLLCVTETRNYFVAFNSESLCAIPQQCAKQGESLRLDLTYLIWFNPYGGNNFKL